jgi:hypothetical protein
MTAPYVTDQATGDGWTMLLGDSCERLAELADESVDLSCYSPPFAGLFIYSATPRDIGNSANLDEFFTHFGFIIREMFRATKPGRMTCVHAAEVAQTKATHGETGLYDLPGDIIRAHVEAGWIYYGRWYVDKDPQVQAQRTKSQALLFVTKNRDASRTRPAIGDCLLLFRKPGDSQVPIPHTADGSLRPDDVSNDDWISWARPVWIGIRESRTLNARIAREDNDTKHMTPLQLDFIERCIRLWSNPGELVVSPFAGVGSEVYAARTLGRRGWGCELKPSYWQTAVKYLRELDAKMDAPSLFDDPDTPDLDATTEATR